MQSRQVPSGGNDRHPSEAHEHRQQVPRSQPLPEQKRGEQNENDGPGVVERLGLLRRKKVVRTEEHEVVEKRVEQS